jgi:hypothetical protein
VHGQAKKPDAGAGVDCSSDYKQVVRCALPTIVQGRLPLAGAEISSLRPTRLTQLGDSITCVKLNAETGASFIAVFLIDNKYSDARRAVAIDGCRNETYVPLASPSVVKTRMRKRRTGQK